MKNPHNVLQFRKTIYDYYRREGRDLPWRRTNDPYCVLVSEIMLQQTQVDRVRGKYGEFLASFPTVEALARAPQGEVIAAWQGLGYNRRALNLKKTARLVVDEHGGTIPDSSDLLKMLPGIGEATAGALCAFAFNKPTPFIETNIRRVFIHFFFSKKRRPIHDRELMPLIEKALDRKNPREWYWALMDYGSMLARAYPNPNRRSQHYTKQNKFEGSDRQIRGRILKQVLARPTSKTKLIRETGSVASRIEKILGALESEGFIEKKGQKFVIA